MTINVTRRGFAAAPSLEIMRSSSQLSRISSTHSWNWLYILPENHWLIAQFCTRQEYAEDLLACLKQLKIVG
jgi:hypothetical protein